MRFFLVVLSPLKRVVFGMVVASTVVAVAVAAAVAGCFGFS